MKFQCTAAFWVLLNASSSSSFATSRSNYRPISVESRTKNINDVVFLRNGINRRLPFVPVRGGSTSTGTQMSASPVESATAVSSENLALLSERGQKALSSLIENDIDGHQAHVYSDWPEAGTQDDDKLRLAEQVSR